MMHGPKEKQSDLGVIVYRTLVPSFLLYHISTIFELKKKEKDDEKVRKFRVGRH